MSTESNQRKTKIIEVPNLCSKGIETIILHQFPDLKKLLLMNESTLSPDLINNKINRTTHKRKQDF